MTDLLSISTNLVYNTCVNIGQFVDSLLIILTAVNEMHSVKKSVKNQVL